MRLEFCALFGLLLAQPVLADPLFVPVEVPLHVYSGGWEHFVGGGLAVLDCDGDTRPDLYAAGGFGPAQLLRNRSGTDGGIQFEADTPPALALNGVTGAYPLDIDSDGHIDLAVLRVGENLLLRGGPECAFAPFDELGFASDKLWTTAFSATWERGKSLPTLAFGNYVDRQNPKGPFRACDVNNLYRPEDNGYTIPVALTPGYCALSMLFSDWNRNGRADLRISNDRHYYVDAGEEQLWAMESEPRPFGSQDGWRSHKLWGMGIASRDLDGDGRTEVFLTSMGDQRLQRRTAGAEGPTYEDVPYRLGTTAQRPYLGGDGRPSTGWHVAFGDIQNDGRDDIFIAKGNVEQMPDSAMEDPNNLLIQLPDGRFDEFGGAAGIASLHRARGAALTDLNRDGRVDLVVVNRRAPLEVWQNVTPNPGAWLMLRLRQPAPNPDAVGAWIELEMGAGLHVRELTVGGGHAGGVAGPQHFGLGVAAQVRFRVVWPDGVISDWVSASTNQRLAVLRVGSGLKLSAY